MDNTCIFKYPYVHKRISHNLSNRIKPPAVFCSSGKDNFPLGIAIAIAAKLIIIIIVIIITLLFIIL